MTNKQLHRLKKQWLAEGYRKGLSEYNRLDEAIPGAGLIWQGAKFGAKKVAKVAGKYLLKGARGSIKALKPTGKMLWKGTKSLLKQATIDLLKETLSDLLKSKGAEYAQQITKTTKGKAATSKNAFQKLFYEALAKIPYEEAINLTVDSLSENIIQGIDGALSQADGYVSPTDKEVEQMLNEYKSSKGRK